MYIDVKNTVWERINIGDLSKEKQAELINKLKRYATDIYGILEESEIEIVNSETLYDTGTQMTLEENDWWSTVEVFDEKYSLKPVFKNGN